MKLYYSETLMPRKACAAARHLGSPVTFVHVSLAKGEQKAPDYVALNPNGKVPLLVDGDRVVWEANAIICHLSMIAGADLWPKDPDRQVDVVRWLSWDSVHFTRYAGQLYFEHVIKARFGLGEPDLAAVEEATGYFNKYAGILEQHLSGRKFLVSDNLSVADFAVAVTLPYAREAAIPLDNFPTVREWHERLSELPAWRDPFPKTTKAA